MLCTKLVFFIDGKNKPLKNTSDRKVCRNLILAAFYTVKITMLYGQSFY